ncbi:MAG: type II toxin-antitoxin system RelE/ParE family toxin [Rickettsiales bacterium]
MKIESSVSSYILTTTARKHLREAKIWSRTRWGKELTTQYFHDLEKAALYLASHHHQSAKRQELSGENGLNAYPVREHYIIYVPVSNQKIVIVAFIRQTRDIPTLLRKYAYLFKKELGEIRRNIN